MNKTSYLLTQGLGKEDKKRLESEFLSSPMLLAQINKVLSTKLQDTIVEQQKDIAYNLPAWPFKQAYSNGYQKAISDIITLLQPREKSDHDR